MENLEQDIVARYSDHGRYFRGTYDPRGLEAIRQGKKEFPFEACISYKNYTPRQQMRYLLIADEFKQVLSSGSMLDVGSRDATLEQIVGRPCQLIDKNNPALATWDWERDPLPFGENQFDNLVCLDTLEHINDFHRAFDDLLRVTRKYLIISLPNCWRKMFKQMFQGRGTSASYGLPPEKPMDRHKWFFNAEEAENFFFYQSMVSAHPFRVKRLIHHLPVTISRHRLQYPLMQWLLPERYAKNLLTNTIFVLLEKK